MPLRYSIVISIIVILLLTPITGISQVTKIIPEKPKWGDKLQVIYNPKAESAKFLPGDEIYAVCFVFLSDSTERRWAKMHKDGEIFKYVMPVEENMAFLTIYFLTSEHWDRKAKVSTMVYRSDGLPAKGAYIRTMKSSSSKENYLDFFKKEIELYPDNYIAYRDKWFIQRDFDPKNLKITIKQDINLLEKKLNDGPVELLYSLSYGYMELGERRKSHTILKEMIEKYPYSYYTGRALDFYERQTSSKQVKGEDAVNLERMKLELIRKSPKSQYSREKVRLLSRQMEVPLSLIESICEHWINDEPGHPWPYFYLAMAYFERKKKLTQAAELANQAINHLLKGKLLLYEDHTGIITKMEMPWFYEISSDIHSQLSNYAKALADIKTAKLLQIEPRPGYHLKEAIIWQKVGIYSKAEQECLRAIKLGSAEAKDFLKEIYLKRNNTLNGFQEYISERTEKPTKESSEEKELALEFDVVNLDGDNIRLADMRGKALVLNFWYIGCAPCRIEMPGLNNLVREFKDKDIVFIAFALDKEEDLKEFLKKTPFNYEIVPNSLEIARKFGVRAFPTHIIINKEGRIEFTLIGGSENRHEMLRPLIIDVLK